MLNLVHFILVWFFEIELQYYSIYIEHLNRYLNNKTFYNFHFPNDFLPSRNLQKANSTIFSKRAPEMTSENPHPSHQTWAHLAVTGPKTFVKFNSFPLFVEYINRLIIYFSQSRASVLIIKHFSAFSPFS